MKAYRHSFVTQMAGMALTTLVLAGLCGIAVRPARAYNGPTHQALVEEAFRILDEMYPVSDIHGWYEALETRCGGAGDPVSCDVPRQGGGSIDPDDDPIRAIAREAKNADYYLDLAQVDVATWEDCVFTLQCTDVTHHTIDLGPIVFANFTANSHYIDMSGRDSAEFDDYDGYCSRSAVQEAAWESTVGMSPDELVAWWFNDEYVGIEPGDSPALYRYASSALAGAGADAVEEELEDRFPQFAGRFQQSVFMPLDNMATYWYNRFIDLGDHEPRNLGPVLHAAGDATIPMHAHGVRGVWHTTYEDEVELAHLLDVGELDQEDIEAMVRDYPDAALFEED
jgi:hypothetical protein